MRSVLRDRFVRAGFVVGIALAAGVETWRQHAFATAPASASEGIWLQAAVWAVVLGFPVNALLSGVVDQLAALLLRVTTRVDPFHLLLFGIVANWMLIGWCVGRVRRDLLAPLRRDDDGARTREPS